MPEMCANPLAGIIPQTKVVIGINRLLARTDDKVLITRRPRKWL
ncbi:hypothetical protein [Sodalis-like endosymbiont of Proechinophthirus fluctus]|nr:hypothetical protein [Sodalis-like endosymbiont of Proechinophthirus fluctus]